MRPLRKDPSRITHSLFPVFFIAVVAAVIISKPASAARINNAFVTGIVTAASGPTASSDDFVITVKTDNPGTSPDTQFTIPTTGSGYNYNLDCDDDGVHEATGVTGSTTCVYTSPGTYTVRIKDNTGSGTGFPRIYFNNSGDKDKLLTIEQWGTGQWTSMRRAFYGCSNLAGQATDVPNLSNVTDMNNMFANATAFNQDIGGWDTSNVTILSAMFAYASDFNQDIGGWYVSSLTNATYMFYGVKLSTRNYDSLLMGWNAQTLQSGVYFHGGDSNYCNGEAARANMISADGWTITDGGKDCSELDFVITVNTDNPGTSSNTQFTIPTYSGETYNYNVDCNDDGTDEATGLSGNYTCNYGSAGTYTVRIKDNTGLGTGYPRIYFNDSGDKAKLQAIEQWGAGK